MNSLIIRTTEDEIIKKCDDAKKAIEAIYKHMEYHRQNSGYINIDDELILKVDAIISIRAENLNNE